jgi:protein-tyrosine phosphatase
MVKVLFVCMGNICRSPTAHGVFLKMLEDQSLAHLVEVDSAGTHAYHIGKAPDERSRSAALRRGVDLSPLRARQVEPADFQSFDYVLAMDDDNLQHLEMICPLGQRGKLRLFMEFAPQMKKREVPDPYYGGSSGFEQVLDLVEAAAEGLLQEIRQRHLK